MADPTEFVLTETLPANVDRRSIPWGAKIGDTIKVTPPQVQVEVPAPSAALANVLAEVASEAGIDPASLGTPPAQTPVEVAPAQATAQAPAPTPATVPAEDRISRLEQTMEKFFERLSGSAAPAPVAVPPPPAPTTLDVAAIRRNPVEALKAAGIDPATLATYLPGAQLTPEVQVNQSLAAMKAEMDQRFAELAAREAEFKQAQEFTQLRAQAETTVKAVDATKFPTAAKIAAKDPAWVQERVLEGIELARRQNLKMTVEEALAGLEPVWSSFASRISDPAPVATTAATPVSTPTPAPSEAPSQKQPPRPLKWERPDDETGRRQREVLKDYLRGALAR